MRKTNPAAAQYTPAAEQSWGFAAMNDCSHFAARRETPRKPASNTKVSENL